MKIIEFLKKNKRPLINSIAVGIFMILIFSMIILYSVDRDDRDRTLDLTRKYINFENRLQSFILNNSTLVEGLSAYIETTDEKSEQDVYNYLDCLLAGKMDNIKNVAILKDTTITWNYPREGNESTIGLDLSTVPSQYHSVYQVKTTLNNSFEGPVSLLQGGTAYIIRTPIKKENKYWGQASIVLYEDKVIELFDSYADQCNIEVAISINDDKKTTIYGDPSIKEKNPVIINGNLNNNYWVYYIIPVADTIEESNLTLIFIIISGISLNTLITLKSYKYFKKQEEIRKKNVLLNKTSIKDKLTEIYNRSYLDTIIVEEINRANRNESSLSIIYFDIDYFKDINDNYGHSFGDVVLKEVASLVKSYLRLSDIFARWGGDEFAIVLPNTPLKGALTVAEKIRKMMHEYRPEINEGITISIGVAEYGSLETPEQLFERVDKALYYAKECGRDAVCSISLEGVLTCNK